MGALEGAAITVLSKGVNFPVGSVRAPTRFPTGTLLLQNVPGSRAVDHCTDRTNPFPSNFECNPSSIDGLGITDSSQGGGGIFVHAWGHNLQIANNRIYNNAGTLSGGINVGQGEFPGAYFGGAGAANADPGSCQTSAYTNLQLPYCLDMNVNVHNNYITQNSSTGDELFSATPAGAGGSQLLHRHRLLQVQLQLALRQLEFTVTVAASVTWIRLQRRHRAQPCRVQPEHQPDDPDQRWRIADHGCARRRSDLRRYHGPGLRDQSAWHDWTE